MRDRQRYKCKNADMFLNKSRKKYKVDINKLYYRYSIRKQTYSELAEDYNISIKTVQKYLDLCSIQNNKTTFKRLFY